MGDRNSKVPGFEFRKGIDSFPDFRGINRQDDPGAIPQDQFYLLQNARVKGSEVISRGGLSAGVNIGTASGIIDNLEHELAGPLWFGNTSSPNLFDITPDDTLNKLTVSSGGTPNLSAFARYSVDGYLYFGGFDALGNQYLYRTNGARLANNVLEQAGTFAGPNTSAEPTSIISFNSRLYIGLQDSGGANPTIYYWNGSTFALEDTATVTSQAPLLVQSHAGELMCAWRVDGGSPATTIRRRNSGTWSNIAVPGSLGGGFNCTSAVVYAGATYFSGWATANFNGVILKWDGSSLTKVNGLFSNNTPITGLAVLGSNLYYYWGTSTSAKIGMFDGATWTDSYKDLNSQFGGTPIALDGFGQPIGGFMATSTNLYVAGQRTLVGLSDIADIYKSPASNLSGNWTLIGSTEAGDAPLSEGFFTYIVI